MSRLFADRLEPTVCRKRCPLLYQLPPLGLTGAWRTEALEAEAVRASQRVVRPSFQFRPLSPEELQCNNYVFQFL